MARFATFVVALATVVASFACGGSSNPNPNAPTTPTPAPVMAPPPAGVSAAVWHVAFMGDVLFRPEPATVHLDLSGLSTDEQSYFAERISVAQALVQGKTTFDLVPGGSGATFVVSIVPGLVCGTSTAAAGCTDARSDVATGRVMGGTMKFISAAAMHQKLLALHEILRTLGLTGVAPSGIMAFTAQEPTDEDVAMLRGRYNYPLLAVFTDH